MTKVKELIKKYESIREELRAYNLALNTIYFDDTTIAPKKGFNERNKLTGILEMKRFYLLTSKEYEDTIIGLKENYDNLSAVYKRIVDISYKDLQLRKKIPPEEMEKYSDICNQSSHYWEEAKEKSSFALWYPYISQVFDYTKKFAHYYGPIDGSYYNTYLDQYEEGITVLELDKFFATLKSEIVPLLEKIKKSKVIIDDSWAKKKVNKTRQLKMSKYIAKTIGYDLSRGVIAESAHPYTNDFLVNDVRFTTHIYENMFLSNLFSCAHEGGHGIYGQNINPKYAGTILYDGASMAFHESQSRMYENIICRSYEFCKLVFPKVKSLAGKAFKDVSVEQFYQACNKVEPSFVRTEADELTYCLHIMVRYEIEKMLMNDELETKDLAKVWNQKYQEYLGITPKNDKEGVLQDVHWNSGVGYFFSYALGNAYSAQIYHTMCKDINVPELILQNKVSEIKKWLKEHMYCYGAFLTPKELIVKVTGEPLNPKYYCDYLKEKFSKIYNLK